MKEIQLKNDININDTIKEKKEYKSLGRYRKRIDGGKIFVYSIEKETIKEAEYQKDQTYDPNNPSKPKLIVESNCIYIESLNIKNAIKRLIKGKIILRT